MTRFLECSGNGFRTYLDPDVHREETLQQVEGLTSTSEWIGVPVATLFKEVGVLPGAKRFLSDASDDDEKGFWEIKGLAWNGDGSIVYGEDA